MFKSVVKVCGSTVKLQLILDILKMCIRDRARSVQLGYIHCLSPVIISSIVEHEENSSDMLVDVYKRQLLFCAG